MKTIQIEKIRFQAAVAVVCLALAGTSGASGADQLAPTSRLTGELKKDFEDSVKAKLAAKKVVSRAEQKEEAEYLDQLEKKIVELDQQAAGLLEKLARDRVVEDAQEPFGSLEARFQLKHLDIDGMAAKLSVFEGALEEIAGDIRFPDLKDRAEIALDAVLKAKGRLLEEHGVLDRTREEATFFARFQDDVHRALEAAGDAARRTHGLILPGDRKEARRIVLAVQKELMRHQRVLESFGDGFNRQVRRAQETDNRWALAQAEALAARERELHAALRETIGELDARVGDRWGVDSAAQMSASAQRIPPVLPEGVGSQGREGEALQVLLPALKERLVGKLETVPVVTRTLSKPVKAKEGKREKIKKATYAYKRVTSKGKQVVYASKGEQKVYVGGAIGEVVEAAERYGRAVPAGRSVISELGLDGAVERFSSNMNSLSNHLGTVRANQVDLEAKLAGLRVYRKAADQIARKSRLVFIRQGGDLVSARKAALDLSGKIREAQAMVRSGSAFAGLDDRIQASREMIDRLVEKKSALTRPERLAQLRARRHQMAELVELESDVNLAIAKLFEAATEEERKAPDAKAAAENPAGSLPALEAAKAGVERELAALGSLSHQVRRLDALAVRTVNPPLLKEARRLLSKLKDAEGILESMEGSLGEINVRIETAQAALGQKPDQPPFAPAVSLEKRSAVRREGLARQLRRVGAPGLEIYLRDGRNEDQQAYQKVRAKVDGILSSWDLGFDPKEDEARSVGIVERILKEAIASGLAQAGPPSVDAACLVVDTGA